MSEISKQEMLFRLKCGRKLVGYGMGKIYFKCEKGNCT